MRFFDGLVLRALRPWLSAILSRWELMPKFGKPRTVNEQALLDRCESWVYKCALTNAQAVAAVPLRLYVRGGTKRFSTRKLTDRQKQYIGTITKADSDDVDEITDEGHPLLSLIGDANPAQSGYEVRVFSQLHLELIGNAYWYIGANGLGVPGEIWPLMGQYMKIIPDEQQFVAGYLYGKDSTKQIRFEPDSIIHFAMANPKDLWYGMSPLQAACKAADRSTAMGDYQQEFFDNSARVDMAITVPEGTPKTERTALYKEWLQKFQGKGKRWLPLVLTGDMSVEQLSFAPSDTGIIEAAKFSREEIATIFGIPMTMLEISASRAEAEAQLWGYATYTLLPRLRLLESVLNERLATRFDERLFLAFDNPVPENVQQLAEQDDKYLRNFVYTINEVRARQGLEPVEYGDMPINPQSGMPILTESPAPAPFRSMTPTEKSLPPMRAGERRFYEAVLPLLDRQRREVVGNLERGG